MRLVKSIIPKKTKTLYCPAAFRHGFFLTFLVLFSAAVSTAFGQDNSPYSRFGIGDLVPPTSTSNRSMGGISAGNGDHLSINFNNPASYSAFETSPEPKSGKISSGRAILDIGMNFENRMLQEKSAGQKFTASNALFSYVQVGMPIKKNWGISFGLRPLSRISYKIFHSGRLKDPNTGLPIDSATDRYEGDGGTYLASLGTGLAVFSKAKKNGMIESLNVGVNAGYLFGKKDYSSRRSLINDTVEYFQANYETRTSYGDLHFDMGMQYKLPLAANTLLTAGVYGSWSQKLRARQDRIRETFVYDANFGAVRLDSVSDLRDVKGKIILPASYTFGFTIQKYAVVSKEGGWILGMDFTQQNWDQYRVYGEKDSVRNKWEFRVGGQLNPVPKRNYFSNVAYRAGFFIGPDYIKLSKNLPQLGFTFGMGLPIPNQNRLSPYQASILNLGFEYIKRGNNNNLLRENLFRVSLGFSLSDVWFIKRKYD